jgi:hypothetical protein
MGVNQVVLRSPLGPPGLLGIRVVLLGLLGVDEVFRSLQVIQDVGRLLLVGTKS